MGTTFDRGKLSWHKSYATRHQREARLLVSLGRAALVWAVCVLSAVAAPRPVPAACDAGNDPAGVATIIVAIFAAGSCPGTDVNGDALISAADVTATVLNRRTPPSPTPSASTTATPTATCTATPTATSTDTATETPTAASTVTATETPTAECTATSTTTSTVTLTATSTVTPTATSTATSSPTPSVPCPIAGGDLTIVVDDRSGDTPPRLRLSGRLLASACRNQSGLAEAYTIDEPVTRLLLPRLVPGLWVHTVEVDTGQLQHQTSLVLANTGPNLVRFTVFATVLTVRTAADTLGGGSLRDALLAAPAAHRPALIQFDPQAFPPGVPTTVQLGSALPRLSASQVTLDGTDATGAVGNRGIDAAGLPIPALSITGAVNTVIGLRLGNSGGSNRDALSLSGLGAVSNVIVRCRIAQSATGDGIGIDNGAGSDFASTVNTIRDCEITAASDKGIKVTTNSYARLEGNWVHDNLNGGVQATLSGHIATRDNLIERSGGASAQNGLAANGTAPDTPDIPSEIESDGDIARFNAANGISVRGASLARISNAYLAGNGSSGLRVFDQGLAPPASAVVTGTTVACNGVNGAVVADSSHGDFGGGAFGSPGNNAFTQTGDTDANLRNSTTDIVAAANNQWEHCGPDTLCDAGTIAAHDLSDHGARTAFLPAQAQRSLNAPVVTGVRPSKGLADGLLRIFGTGFNAIDGHAAGTADGAACVDVAARNQCLPLRGNCVQIGGVAAAIEAVTPTMLVVRWPSTCVEPVPLTVQTQGGGTSAPIMVCTNDGEQF